MIDLEENKRKLEDVEKRFQSLESTVGKIEELEVKLKDLENETLKEGFWNDSKASSRILQEIKDIKSKYSGLKNIKQNLSALKEMNDILLTENDEELSVELAKNTFSIEKELEKLEIKMLLSGKYDRNNAIITLHPGAGRNRITRLGTNVI